MRVRRSIQEITLRNAHGCRLDVAFVHGAVNPVLSPLLPLLNNYALSLSAPLELYRQP